MMTHHRYTRAFIRRSTRALVAATLGVTLGSAFAQTVDLADKPLFSTTNVPGNLVLALSVEWPTASTPAYLSTAAYASSNKYLGYFDPAKCYRYVYVSATPSTSYFTPHSAASSRTCTSSSANALWSGNYLNWAAMQSLDIFRWVLTGGDRVVDTTAMTVLEKTRHSGQGDRASIFPDKRITGNATIQGATPMTWAGVTAQVHGLGNAIYISNSAVNTTAPSYADYQGTYNPSETSSGNPVFYRVFVRVRVCESTGLESNCKAYGTTAAKPEGLMQQYAQQLRYSAFGYLNDDDLLRDGGVMRARLKSIGPTTPVPGGTATTNANAEWSSTTGIMSVNPDSADATATQTDASAAGYTVTINNSGVMNYLNRFGKVTTGDYKGYDPVSEMYYAATRYLKNQGNVAAYSNLSGAGSAGNLAKWIDGFPVVRTWDDPVQYSCQRNFILGIGDVYAWADKNLPGSTITSNSADWYSGANEPSMPTEVSSDTSVNVRTATNMVGQLEGQGTIGQSSDQYRANSKFIAGLAYDSHTKDIRTDIAGTQTIDTYWLDVREAQTYESKNQYWLAAKYGGFKTPGGFSPYAATNDTSTLTQPMWATTGQLVGTDPRPDNYYIASDPQALADGLKSAFESIVAANEAATATAFSTTTAKVTRTGTASFATMYNPRDWSGDLEASEITFNSNGVPTLTKRWSAAALLDATTPSTRKIVTCCTAAGAALPFTSTSLASATLGTRTSGGYGMFDQILGVTATQSKANYVDYLRGDRTKELANGGAYRTRGGLLSDLVNSRANPVGPPNFPFSDQFNPGYSEFKTTYANRKPVVYVGSNGGMLHAFDGGINSSCTTCGTELFAFIPSFVYGTNTTAQTDGLASLGNPTFAHRPLVDGTAQNYDLDLARTSGSGTTTPNWRSVVVGAMGKGGKGYYALDVTDPTSWTNEAAVAGKFMWEWTDSRLGYTFGEPVVARTTKYGWVVAVPSGFNNSDGKGYLFLINPRTGALLEAIGTTEGSTAAPINLSQINGFVPSSREYVLDAIYGGDLRGGVWRFDLRAASGAYPSPTKIASLTDSSGTAQPITVRPLIEVDPTTDRRHIVVGTGRLMGDSDILSSQRQSIYSILDGTSGTGEFNTSLPTGYTFPITRASLNANTDLLAGVGSSPAKPLGWYHDLNVTGSVGERVNIDMVGSDGMVLLGVNLPSGQACNPEGSGRVIGVRVDDGRSIITQVVGGTKTQVASSPSTGFVTTLAILNVGGEKHGYYGTSDGSTSVGGSAVDISTATCTDSTGQAVKCTDLMSSIVGRRLNWREIQPAN